MLRVSPAAGSSVSAPPPPHQQWPQLEGQFAANGYCVVRGVLDPPSIDQMRAALAESRSQHPEDWTTYGMSRDGGPVGESGRWQTSKPLAHSSAFDAVVAHPAVLPLVRRIMGNPCITGVGACVRDPVHDPAPAPGEQWPPGTAATAPWPEGSEIHWAMFHREMGGLHLPSHPYACPSVQVRFQLDDCDGSTHTVRSRARARACGVLPPLPLMSSYGTEQPGTFAPSRARALTSVLRRLQMSTVPESVEAKRALPTEPRGDYYSQITGQFIVDSWRNMHLPEAVDIHVNAGDVIILNNSNIHCGTVRRTSQARRDVNVGYGHKGLSLSGRTTPKP